ncbi:DUF3164 family protein [Azospirillum picis]|uniref:Sulfate transporter n=1 Tax=Azospirillum picis TaxID=488438 RepID=A0ABU0MPP2_9PROT|nr:DUF3164 family protein [Azospirillum picis]MBP2301280.1 hypothetical protein [Azospirillum picis]MDQ0535111.1 hypothetical protein [Azospirillum picis]
MEVVTNTDTPATAPAIPAGYMADAKGRLVPEALVKPTDKLQDQLVRKLMGYADDLSAQVARFKAHTFDDVGAFLALLAEQYQDTRGGQKGNMTLTSFDGTMKVQVAVADHMTFGPELQIAKNLIDACIADWSTGANDNIRALVEHAFRVDQEGQVSRDAIFALRRVAIEDERWKQAMAAIADSVRIEGTKSYVRFYRRPSPDAAWKAVTIDLASA